MAQSRQTEQELEQQIRSVQDDISRLEAEKQTLEQEYKNLSAHRHPQVKAVMEGFEKIMRLAEEGIKIGQPPG